MLKGKYFLYINSCPWGDGDIQKPVQAISITGLWMEEHPADLKWILDLIKKNEISVVWINHSFNHHYKKKLPLTRNFLLTKGTNINKEILNTEIKMIENGIIPLCVFSFSRFDFR